MAAFRLARVARLRTRLRELREAELRSLAGRLARLQSERLTTRTERDRCLEDEARGAALAPVDEPTFRLGRAWEAALARREAELAERIAETLQAIAEKRAELLRSREDERKLSKLEERHDARVAESARRRLDAAMDELAIQAHYREEEGVGDGG